VLDEFFDCAGSRIRTDSFVVGEKPWSASARYAVAIKEYLASGKDGYEMLMHRPILAKAESLPQLAALIKEHFDSFTALNQMRANPGFDDSVLSVGVRIQMPLIETNIHVERKEDGTLVLSAKTDGRIVCLSDGSASGNSGSKTFTILHFNDVYEIQSRRQEPAGGAARFVQRLKAVPGALVLFSGDALAPSIMSLQTKGEHMIKFLNMMNIKAACMGNHDFDFGAENLVKMVAASNFPWMISNVCDAKTGKRMAGGLETVMLTHEGIKIGLMGLIEEEWLATLATINRNEVAYVDYVEVGRRLNAELRAQGAEMVIALTHMRNPNDLRLAREVPELDLILGGHDHDVYSTTENGVPMIKSGTDFRNFTKITVTLAESGTRRTKCEWVVEEVVGADAEDPVAAELVEQYSGELEKSMQKVLGYLGAPLDSRFGLIRTQETNCSNWIADTMRLVTKADVVIFNSGTLRADALIPEGPFLMRDLFTLLPMLDDLVTIELTGAELLSALENGVSQYPKLEGRFPCVSGVRFAFDPSKDPGATYRPGPRV